MTRGGAMNSEMDFVTYGGSNLTAKVEIMHFATDTFKPLYLNLFIRVR